MTPYDACERLLSMGVRRNYLRSWRRPNSSLSDLCGLEVVGVPNASYVFVLRHPTGELPELTDAGVPIYSQSLFVNWDPTIKTIFIVRRGSPGTQAPSEEHMPSAHIRVLGRIRPILFRYAADGTGDVPPCTHPPSVECNFPAWLPATLDIPQFPASLCERCIFLLQPKFGERVREDR
ncbi:hypothetical protein OE88DRAFT_1662538 [Heliocybe sulcata]|uniref:Uncharacterized protein n=1 Tax=Heliocybe sulcata TaxID=5364 RepID=A0A5C3MWF3_9AGAM|nr:hypothetical protein OE88DRAFT_1662538 [Heliocybe sulcata]